MRILKSRIWILAAAILMVALFVTFGTAALAADTDEVVLEEAPSEDSLPSEEPGGNDAPSDEPGGSDAPSDRPGDNDVPSDGPDDEAAPDEPSSDPAEPSPDPSEPSPDPESGPSQSDTSKGSPRTGDETAVWIWMAVELISLYGIVEGLKKLRKT